jgi:hypothetical protein
VIWSVRLLVAVAVAAQLEDEIGLLYILGRHDVSVSFIDPFLSSFFLSLSLFLCRSWLILSCYTRSFCFATLTQSSRIVRFLSNQTLFISTVESSDFEILRLLLRNDVSKIIEDRVCLSNRKRCGLPANQIGRSALALDRREFHSAAAMMPQAFTWIFIYI